MKIELKGLNKEQVGDNHAKMKHVSGLDFLPVGCTYFTAYEKVTSLHAVLRDFSYSMEKKIDQRRGNVCVFIRCYGKNLRKLPETEISFYVSFWVKLAKCF